MKKFGMTTEMLEKVAEEAVSGENKKIVVIAEDQNYAKFLMSRFVEKNCGGVRFKYNPSANYCLEFENGNIVYFRGKDFLNTSSYRFQKWKTFQDHLVEQKSEKWDVEKWEAFIKEDLKNVKRPRS